jgi:UDP-N-acetylglucosamine--N-acetylmuramyl-(pentapeptide) pyrophosphoryl-undecaprenol N-acetylglucosamine transferase
LKTRFVVSGTGTGGHIYPALAIAKGLKEKYPGSEILFVGGSYGLESKLVPQAGFQLKTISAAGFVRKFTLKNLIVLGKATISLGRAWQIMRQFQPRVVIGTGGYVCGPVILAAALGGIPTLIHEQNAYPGLTSRVLAYFTRGIAVTFADSKKYFPRAKWLEVTGLPVRSELVNTEIQPEEARQRLGLPVKKRLILSFGGSQGAQSINRAVLQLLKILLNDKKKHFLHVTGPSQYEDFVNQARSFGLKMTNNGNITIVPYLNEMPLAIKAADLAICRAGASTLAELTAVGLPAVLIPYPYAAGNHQEYNALAIVNQGAALLVREQELSGAKLAEIIESLFNSPDTLSTMARNSKKIGRPQALADILEMIATFM